MPNASVNRPQLRINLSACRYEVLREVSEKLKYDVQEKEEDDSSWDVYWSDLSVSHERVQKLKYFQRLNHFPAMLEICRKAQLSRHINRIARRLPDHFTFYPQSLILPDQLEMFTQILKKSKAKILANPSVSSSPADTRSQHIPTFILKPSNGTMGRGISLVQCPLQLAGWENNAAVAQAYVEDPLLLDGFKFDLRIYALVLGVDPLKVYLYQEGLARFATEPYVAPSSSNLHVQHMHLTNYSINKSAPGFISNDALNAGSKRLLTAVLEQVELASGKTGVAKRLLEEIGEVVVKTICSIQPLLGHTYHTSASAQCSSTQACPVDHYAHDAPLHQCTCLPSLCFEVLGFDILLDSQLKPWLLEVNHSPSFACDSALDKQVKSALLADVLTSLGLSPDTKFAFYEDEARAQEQRLYKPGKQWQRPQSASKERPAGNQSGSDRPGSANRNDGSRGGFSDVSTSYSEQCDARRDQGKKAVPIIPSTFMQIFPSPDPARQRKYNEILCVATEIFPDQRCRCAWCHRRYEARWGPKEATWREVLLSAPTPPRPPRAPNPRSKDGAERNATSPGLLRLTVPSPTLKTDMVLGQPHALEPQPPEISYNSDGAKETSSTASSRLPSSRASTHQLARYMRILRSIYAHDTSSTAVAYINGLTDHERPRPYSSRTSYSASRSSTPNHYSKNPEQSCKSSVPKSSLPHFPNNSANGAIRTGVLPSHCNAAPRSVEPLRCSSAAPNTKGSTSVIKPQRLGNLPLRFPSQSGCSKYAYADPSTGKFAQLATLRISPNAKAAT